MAIPKSVTRLLRSLASIGIDDADEDLIRAQKAALTLAASTITILSVIWVASYLALGLPVSAAIPFAYQVATIASLVAFARSKSYVAFRFSQAAMMTALSIEPTTMRTVWAGRRGMFRRPSLSMMPLRRAITMTTAMIRPKAARRPHIR